MNTMCDLTPRPLDYSRAFKPSPVKAYFTTRIGGYSQGAYKGLNLGRATLDPRVKANYDLIDHHMLKGQRLLWANQVHGQGVYVDTGDHTGCVGDYDALVTPFAQVWLSTYHADCYPLYFVDGKTGLVGLAHAGWKGVYHQIGNEVIRVMVNLGASSDTIKVMVGPGIGFDKFEVSEDLFSQFKLKFGSRYVKEDMGAYFVDLRGCLELSLAQAGIGLVEHEDKHPCTYHDEALYYSHRRDKGQTGRMLALISRTGSID